MVRRSMPAKKWAFFGPFVTADGRLSASVRNAFFGCDGSTSNRRTLMVHLPSVSGSLQALSNGSRQVLGATNRWIKAGPHDPGW